MDELKSLVEALGTPVGFTAVMAFSVWRLFRWAAPLGQAMVQRHLEFTAKIEECQSDMKNSIQNLDSHMGDMSVAIRGLVKQVDGLAKARSGV